MCCCPHGRCSQQRHGRLTPWPGALTHQLAYRAIRIEGGLIPADELTRLTTAADARQDTEQTEGTLPHTPRA
jgi:hypothetical protein